MSKVCGICSHPNRLEIDRKLMQGRTLAGLSREYNVSDDTLTNHRDNHISRQLVQAWEKKELMEGMNILSEIEDLIKRTKDILDIAEKKKQYGLALNAIKEARGSYELLSKIAYALHQAKLTEYQMQQDNNQQAEKSILDEFAEDIKILTTDELKVLNKLLYKIRNQSEGRNCLVIRNRTPVEDETNFKPVYRRTKPKPIPNTGDEEIGDYNKDLMAEIKELEDEFNMAKGVRPITGQPIPVQPSRIYF